MGYDEKSQEFVFVMNHGSALNAWICRFIDSWIVRYLVFGFNVEKIPELREPKDDEKKLAERALAKFNKLYPDYEVCPLSLRT
jgi:hypothetical protein